MTMLNATADRFFSTAKLLAARYPNAARAFTAKILDSELNPGKFSLAEAKELNGTMDALNTSSTTEPPTNLESQKLKL